MDHEPDLVRIAENGRLSIPAKYRKLLGLDRGGIAVARMEDGELRLRPVRQVIADLQHRVSKLPPTQESDVDWLQQQRRLEFAKELADIEGAGADEHPGRERNPRPAAEGTGTPDSC
jgi:AbrB family looped-hinge helix DNA binding protein